jgi:hypothetical protein
MSLLLRLLLTASATALLFLPAASFAQDDDLGDLEFEDDEAEEEDESEEIDEEVDTEEIYKEYTAELRGEGPSEEIDAWNRYLEVYTKSLYRLEIDKRVKALEEAAYQETLEERLAEEESNKVDAQDEEIRFLAPTLLSLSPNTRRHIEIGVLWGFSDRFNYEATFEWNFHRQVSVWGSFRHVDRDLGGSLQVGGKGAFIKDTRTGLLMSGMFHIEAGASPKSGFFFAIQPTYGFGFKPNKFFQIQTTLGFRVRVDNGHHQALWNIQAAVSPTDVVSIYFESLQKHSFYSPPTGDARYFGFHQAGVGVKIRPVDAVEISVGANIPYALRLWRDYRYAGVHVNFSVYLPGQPNAGSGDATSRPFGGGKKSNDDDGSLDYLPPQFAPTL